jgi:hypothetical protein
MARGIAPFGQYHVPESPRSLLRLHMWAGGSLKTVDHEPKNAVLDQEDLLAQGIHVSSFIPGARDVDALGSCTANAGVSATSNVLSQANFFTWAGVQSYDDTVGLETRAIKFYNQDTQLSGDPQAEWPPTDCGSSGQYVVQLLQEEDVVQNDTIAHGAQNIVSLMQSDGLLVGMPFLNAWMEPDNNGFVDGNGSTLTLEDQIRMGVAGNHEIYLSAIEQLALSPVGQVEPEATVIRFRNSWSKSWGDDGSARLHLSTFVTLGGYCDFRQLVA